MSDFIWPVDRELNRMTHNELDKCLLALGFVRQASTAVSFEYTFGMPHHHYLIRIQVHRVDRTVKATYAMVELVATYANIVKAIQHIGMTDDYIRGKLKGKLPWDAEKFVLFRRWAEDAATGKPYMVVALQKGDNKDIVFGVWPDTWEPFLFKVDMEDGECCGSYAFATIQEAIIYSFLSSDPERDGS